jgi:hypothetical protein
VFISKAEKLDLMLRVSVLEAMLETMRIEQKLKKERQREAAKRHYEGKKTVRKARSEESRALASERMKQAWVARKAKAAAQ